MINRRASFKLLICFAFCMVFYFASAQCPQFPTSSITGNTVTLCEGSSVTLSITALNIAPGSIVEWYIGSIGTYNPYIGEGALIGSVPVLPDPFMPGAVIVEDFIWTVPTNFCQNQGGGDFWITGILSPPPSGACPDIFSEFFGLEISCPELNLSGGGDVCEGNCPDNPTEITFNIIGDDVPFLADIVISASVFPPFEIEDLEISNGQSIFVCLEGFFPSFDPASGILNVPILAIGITATVEIVSLTSASGCPVTVSPSSISLNFIGTPSANAGNDEIICADELIMLDGSIGGSATTSIWTTSGDGTFDNPASLIAVYTPGSSDIANGSVILTLTSQDPNGVCVPASSTMLLTIEPSWTVDVGPSQTICNTDVVNVLALITGPPATGFWSTSGDGDFDDETSESTFYTPGNFDLASGDVILFWNMDNNGPCTAPDAPIQVTFVNAPDVDLPTNIEVCTDDSVTIHIVVNGNFTSINWSTSGDGTLILINDTEVNYTPGPQDIDNQFAIVSVTITSGFPQCGQTTYNLPININFCDCDPFETSPTLTPLCALSDIFDLSTMLIDGGPGIWSITGVPPGLNPAALTGNIFTTNLSDPGVYQVTYTLGAPEPGCPPSSNEEIVVQELIEPDAGADMAFCGPQSVLMAGEITPAAPVQIIWETLGDGTFADNSSLNTLYTPGPLDSISAGLFLVLHVLDPVCGNQSDTVTLFINEVPFAVFDNDTLAICNSTANGSVVDFFSLIMSGDAAGTWTNPSGVPVDFSNPSSVDFNAIAEGYYLFQYQTNSAMSPCAEATYDIIVSVEDCICPLLMIQNLPGGICNSQNGLPLDAFVMAGAPGSWSIINTPPGVNPGTLSGSTFIINGCDPGMYNLRFTFDAAPIVGCPDSAEIEIFIQEQPTLSISGDTSTCGQNEVQLIALIGGSATGVLWTTSGLGSYSDLSGLNPVYTPSILDIASAQINLIATSVDTFGFCNVPEDTILLFLVTPPFTTFSTLTDTLCSHPDSGSVINLFSFIMEGDGTGFWIDIDGAMVDLSNPAQVDFDGVDPGSYRLVYTTQTALAPCTDSMYTFTVLVEDCGCPPLVISSDILSLCQGTSLDLNDQLINVAPGNWLIAIGPSGTWPVIMGTVISTTDAAGGTYTLVYTLIDSIPDCPASANLTLVVDAPPFFNVQDVICDDAQLFYEVVIETEADFLTADIGDVTMVGIGSYIIESIPVDQDVQILATFGGGLCLWVFDVAAPDCSCTLFAEDIADTITFCPGDTFVLIPIVTGAQGLPFSTWITPDGTKMQPTLPLYEEGSYIWIVRDMAGCEQRDTFNAEFIGPEGAIIESVSPSCPGQTDGQLIIESIIEGTPPYTIQLDNGPINAVTQLPFVIQNVGLGNHFVSITDIIGCTLEVSVTIVNQDFGSLDIGLDVVIQKGDSVRIQPIAEDIVIAGVEWNPSFPGLGIEDFWFAPEVTTLVSAIVQDTAGCFFEDELLITVLEKETFYIPNIFSPNDDQVNDAIEIITNVPVDRLVSLEIYDRWGSLIYGQYGNAPFRWDATSKSEKVQSGVYVYKLIWTDQSDATKVKVGDITVIR